MNFCGKIFDWDKMQFFYKLLKTFKFAAILVRHSHQSSSVWSESWRRFRNTWFGSWQLTWKQVEILLQLSTFSWKCRKGALPLFVTTLMIQKTTSVFIVGSWTYVLGISHVAILSTLLLWSVAGIDRKKIEFWTFLKALMKDFSWLLLRWPNAVFARAFADAIQRAHKDCKKTNMPSIQRSFYSLNTCTI